MRTDLRVKHDVETRRHAAELFDLGMGCRDADADAWLAINFLGREGGNLFAIPPSTSQVYIRRDRGIMTQVYIRPER